MFLLKFVIAQIKNLHVIAKTKNLHVPWQFDSKSILHQTMPMAIFGSQNSMGVLQNDELLDKMNTKGIEVSKSYIIVTIVIFSIPQ